MSWRGGDTKEFFTPPPSDLPKVLNILEEADVLFRDFRERSGKVSG